MKVPDSHIAGEKYKLKYPKEFVNCLSRLVLEHFQSGQQLYGKAHLVKISFVCVKLLIT